MVFGGSHVPIEVQNNATTIVAVCGLQYVFGDLGDGDSQDHRVPGMRIGPGIVSAASPDVY